MPQTRLEKFETWTSAIQNIAVIAGPAASATWAAYIYWFSEAARYERFMRQIAAPSPYPSVGLSVSCVLEEMVAPDAKDTATGGKAAGSKRAATPVPVWYVISQVDIRIPLLARSTWLR